MHRILTQKTKISISDLYLDTVGISLRCYVKLLRKEYDLASIKDPHVVSLKMKILVVSLSYSFIVPYHVL